MEYKRRSSNSPKMPKSPTSPTFEQLLRVEDAERRTSLSPTFGHHHDPNESNHVSPTHNNKKSVLTIVREKAKKLRHNLSGKKKHEGGPNQDNITPSWGVTLDDDDDDDDDDEKDEDPEYLGAPMYESEAAPEVSIETARQHPRAIPVLSEKHVLSNTITPQQNKEPIIITPNKTLTEIVSEKIAPAYAAMSDATQNITSKIAGLTVTTPEPQKTTTALAPIQTRAAETVNQSNPQKWDKGVSVKEYFLNKLEPGDDEKALSQAITEAISPRKNSGDTGGIVEKVKEAVASFFWHEEEPSKSNTIGSKVANSSYFVPCSLNAPSSARENRVASFNAHSAKVSRSKSANYSTNVLASTSAFSLSPLPIIEEENQGKILQTN